MTLGQIVDYVVEWNDMHNEEGEYKKEEPKRKATQADWDAFWG